ncbi:MAG TPA: ABC transporter permease [Pyrinomonadaceae bacterium]|jgi:lipoprotein-releasing system permease protein|nr:ABC transporter permease [Pyrinomonadaceae bacterium]
MPYEFFLAFRYLRARQKRRLVRVTAVAAMLGIAMGVAALIVTFALSNGFRDEMSEKILQGTAHLSVLRTDGLPITEYDNLAARLQLIDGVESASATTYDGALARGSKGSAYAVIRGIEGRAGQTAQARHWLKEGSFDPLFVQSPVNDGHTPPAVVGAELASRIGISVGDVFQIIPANEAGSETMRRLRVAGIFRSGLFEYDSTWIYVDFDLAATFAGGDHTASVMSIQVKDPNGVKDVASRVQTALGHEYTTVDWQQANQPLFSALALERRMGLFIIGLIIAVAALNITTMLILVVVERRRDIAVLSTLGATRMGVMWLFIIEGAVVGAIGAVAGVMLGLAACVIGNYFKLVSLPADVYSITDVPFNATFGETLIAAFVAFVLSVLATIYPARAAARLRPVEALRDG